MKKIFNKMTKLSVGIMQRYLPDPFIFAIILTFMVFTMALFITQSSPIKIIEAWSKGLWSLLSFSMQMALVLVTGTILATAPAFKKILGKIASIPKNKIQAIIVVNFISLIACFINWGFGLVIGAILAKEVAKKIKTVDYPLLIAAAYSGFIIWHAGLSGSIPLKLASGGDLLAQTGGALSEAVPTNLTIFSTMNLVICAIILFTVPFLLGSMNPNEKDTKLVSLDLLNDEPLEAKLDIKAMTPAQKLENSVAINYILGAMGYAYIFSYFIKNGFNLNLDIVNYIFLFTAIILHGTPINVVNAVNSAAKSTGGIILQFPFYGGIMGIMTFVGPNGTSIAGAMSTFFVNISNQTTFPVFTFFSAGLVNFFVPSGGGQWAVQAPIMMPAGAQLGVSAAKTGMAIAWGDAWTNMIQPFWALPALGIAGLGAKDIMGYCLMVLFYTGFVISLGLAFL